MTTGSVQNVLVCIPVSADQVTSVDQQVCPASGSQAFHLGSHQAYVLSPDAAAYVDAIAQPFDYVQAAGFWGLAFTTIMTLWLVSHGAGAIVNFLRRS